MEIRSIKIDFDKDILEVNGKKVEKPVTVTLPGPDGWPIQKLFNPESYIPESVKRLKVIVSGSEEAAKKDEISKIFSQRMRGFNAHPNDLPVITAGRNTQAILLTMVDALDHMTRTCDVCFYISDLYVTSRLGKITEMAGSGWLDTKGKPIANREEWRRLFKAINQLPDPHKISAKTEKHSYSAWLREEMKHRECGRILGQGLEPAPRTGHINNGMSGYHY